jgi:hypothetical protein
LPQCAWRSRIARFVALNALSQFLEIRKQQLNQEQDEEQQSSNHRLPPVDLKQRPPINVLDSQALDFNNQVPFASNAFCYSVDGP